MDDESWQQIVKKRKYQKSKCRINVYIHQAIKNYGSVARLILGRRLNNSGSRYINQVVIALIWVVIVLLCCTRFLSAGILARFVSEKRTADKILIWLLNLAVTN